jgi:bacillopeptidase F (M6 metalloprotease family)
MAKKKLRVRKGHLILTFDLGKEVTIDQFYDKMYEFLSDFNDAPCNSQAQITTLNDKWIDPETGINYAPFGQRGD